MNSGEFSRFCWVTQRLQHNFKMNKQFSKMLGCLKWRRYCTYLLNLFLLTPNFKQSYYWHTKRYLHFAWKSRWRFGKKKTPQVRQANSSQDIPWPFLSQTKPHPRRLELPWKKRLFLKMYLLLLKMVIFHGHISFLECIIHLMVLCLVNVGSNSINISPNTPLKFNSQIPKMTPSLKPEILPKQTAADAKDFLRSGKKKSWKFI